MNELHSCRSVQKAMGGLLKAVPGVYTQTHTHTHSLTLQSFGALLGKQKQDSKVREAKTRGLM